MSRISYIMAFRKNVKKYQQDLYKEFTKDEIDNAINYYVNRHPVSNDPNCTIDFVQWLSIPFVQDQLVEYHVLDRVHYRLWDILTE